MLKYFAFSLLLVLIHLSEQKVKVTILYEALCPDSINFIKNQLTPNYHSLKDNIDVEFVPYGKAKHNNSSGWSFQCQHGPRECELNIQHACGIKHARSQADQVTFVDCMMKESDYNNGDTAVKKCSKKADIEFDKVEPCYGGKDGKQGNEGKEGKTLIASHGDRTQKFSPNFIPTIIFNDTFNQYYQNQALQNFYSVINELCLREAYNVLMPSDCTNYCCNCGPYSTGYAYYPYYTHGYYGNGYYGK